jgi:predicted glycoside hydrolase/deacetylase ChbG (UPF0249 family)
MVDTDMSRRVIFNADDFGASTGINQGIIDAHTKGVVTSTSFMVPGRAADEAVEMARDHPALSIGLHWDVWGEGEREFDTRDLAASRAELHRQLDEFDRMFGRPPTHIDSHQHAHKSEHLLPVFKEVVLPLGIPLRGVSDLSYIGGFYAQWEWKVTNLEYISVEFLQKLLREEAPEGWTEFSCHPGYISDDFESIYLSEREEEVRTLTDLRISDYLDSQGMQLGSYIDYQGSTTDTSVN